MKIMKMTKTRWIGLILAVSVFLAAFGVGLAVTLTQVMREVPSTFTLARIHRRTRMDGVRTAEGGG